MLRNDNIQLHH